MGYMQGAGQKGLEFVAKVTKLLNSLTEEDYEDTYAYVKVILIEEDSPEEKVLGYWLDEHGPGYWAYFDGEPQSMKKAEKSPAPLMFSDVRSALAHECPPGSTVDDPRLNRMAHEILALLKEKKLL